MKIKQKLIHLLLPILLALPLQAVERKPHGKNWNSLNETAKFLYVLGAQQATLNALSEARSVLFKYVEGPKLIEANDNLDQLINRMMVTDIGNLVKGIDYLYSDPANNYVGTIDILYFAQDRTRGVDISEGLRKARKDSDEFWKSISGR